MKNIINIVYVEKKKSIFFLKTYIKIFSIFLNRHVTLFVHTSSLLLVRLASKGIFSYHFLISRIGSRLGKSRGKRGIESERKRGGKNWLQTESEKEREVSSGGGYEYPGVQRIVEKERARYLAGGR